jgi:hypothetical protein
MKKIKIIYWIFTSLFSFIMLGSAIPDILVQPIAVEGFRELGYPAYLLPFIGIAKFLGVVAILVPGFPRIKEWAYAGLIIDLTGATYSIISSGESASAWGFMALPLILGVGSYIFYHKKEKMRLRASIYPISNQPGYPDKNPKIADAGRLLDL